MSSILSPITEISRLQIEPIPTNKVLRGARVCKVDSITLIVDEQGTFYSSQVRAGCAYSFGSGLEATIKGAMRLGLLSKEAVKQHHAMASEHRNKEARQYAAKSFENQAKVLGIKLTNAQMGRIERAKEGLK
jgi:hypothetical protein